MASPDPPVIAFDVGEVLIDETRVWSIWAELIGVSPLTFMAAMGAAIVQGLDHEVVFEHLAPNVEWWLLAGEHERLLDGLKPHDVYDDVRPCLANLQDMGFTVVLAGNQPAIRREQLLDLSLPCDVVITSEELGVEKPDPAFFARLQNHVGLSDGQTFWYVGDRVDNDVLPCLTAGINLCWLRRGPWGRLQDLPEDAEVAFALEGLGELPLLLEAWKDGAMVDPPRNDRE